VRLRRPPTQSTSDDRSPARHRAGLIRRRVRDHPSGQRRPVELSASTAKQTADAMTKWWKRLQLQNADWQGQQRQRRRDPAASRAPSINRRQTSPCTSYTCISNHSPQPHLPPPREGADARYQEDLLVSTSPSICSNGD